LNKFGFFVVSFSIYIAVRKWLVFLFLSLAVFYLAFGPIGRTLSDLWSACFTWLCPPGVLGAVWTVATTLLGLLPQILILFSFFYFLERSGLNFPSGVIMGFGCTTVAVSLTRNRRTAILLPFVPCSAKAPVVLMVAAALKLNFFVIFLMYVGCVLIGLLVSRLCRSERSEESRVRTDKRFFTSVLSNTLQFFRRISGPVLIAAAVLYFLKTYTFHFQVAANFNQSILFWICDLFSPLFVPLGLGSAAVIAALAFGILGKELVAATMVLFSAPELLLSTASPFGFTTASLAAFIVFFMLYPPCVSAIRAAAAQVGTRTAFLSVALNLIVAYCIAFIVYTLVVVVL
jgi:ferrous iron transport protein B